MHHVYILRSLSHPEQSYICYTALRVADRLCRHNKGDVPHTSKFTPWEVAFYAAFPDKHTALAFETYLKSHSGKAFAAKRFIPRP